MKQKQLNSYPFNSTLASTYFSVFLSQMQLVFSIVLSPAGMELTSFIAGPVVLCFGFMAKTLLITH